MYSFKEGTRSMSVDKQVSAHYTRGMLEQVILDALRSAGKNVERLSARDLQELDNFHVGADEATEALAASMGLRPGMHLLDVGCGIGGPARYFAEQGCRVTGLDLTQEFIEVATNLTRRANLEGKAQFQQGSALEMPFSSGTFDGAYMIHVGMNIQDKAGVFREVARVLKRGARFTIFDIMKKGDAALDFPVPWAANPATSFVSSVTDYKHALEQAGFRIDHERERRQLAIDFMEKMRARSASGSPPTLGVHILMGEQAPLMLKNVNQAIVTGALEPVELGAVAP
jgi:ubiquinone/menaquinone biosynthesis C-methylase UbiE